MMLGHKPREFIVKRSTIPYESVRYTIRVLPVFISYEAIIHHTSFKEHLFLED